MKVCLIGNNLTSLILAHILSKQNFDIEIYSVKSKKRTFKTRTLGISNSNIKFLDIYFNNILKKTNIINEIKVLIDNKKTKDRILFKKKLTPLFHMVKYESLMSFVKAKIRSNKKIIHKFIKNNSSLNLLTKEKKFQIVINCENTNVFTQKFLKKKIFKNYLSKAFTTILTHKKIDNNQAVQVFTDNGPLAFLPLNNTTTSVVFSCDLKNISKISENIILNSIHKHNPKYKIISHEKLESFNLVLKLPKNYFYKNILFFGDSIHSIHPHAGQGFNMTIRDMITLEKIIKKRLNLGLAIDKNVSIEFEKSSKTKNSIFSFGIDFLHEFFRINKDFIPSTVSKRIFNFINNNNKIKQSMIKLANEGNLIY